MSSVSQTFRSSGPVQISDGTDTLDINSDGSINVSANINDLTISSKYRIEQDSTTVTLGTNWVDIYNYSGSGKFFSHSLTFDSEDVQIRFSIDSEVIFSFAIWRIKDVILGNELDRSAGDLFISSNASNEVAFRFTPYYPMNYSSSVRLEGKKDSGADKNMQRQVIALTKET